MIKVLSAAALVAGMATSSFAGNLAVDPVQEVANDAFAAPVSSSGAGLIFPIVGALVVGALVLSDDDDAVVDTSDAD